MIAPRCPLAIVVLFGVACTATPDPDDDGSPLPVPELEFHAETEHLDIHSNARICQGDIDRWEGFIAYGESYLGVTMPTPFDVYVLDAAMFAELAPCGNPTGGCTFSRKRQIIGLAESVHHELVHALAADVGYYDAFVAEGLAEALSNNTRFGLAVPELGLTDFRDVDYAAAGHFVRWLLETRGPEPVLDYMQIPEPTREDFEQIFAVDFDDLVLEFYDDAQPLYPMLYPPDAAALESVGELRWADSLTFDCDRSDVRGAPDGLLAVRKLDIPTTGFYTFWSSTGTVVLRRTTTDLSTIVFIQTFPGTEIASGKIEAGSYDVEIMAPTGIESGVVEIWALADGVPSSPEEAP